jgi:hypothetical protein
MTPSMPRMRRAAVAALLVVAACATSTGPSATRESPGTGSSTLRVVAEINANDDPASGAFSTDYFVTVRDGAGFPVSGAIVTLSHRAFGGGKITLAETATGTGNYQVIAGGFPAGEFQLDVMQGPNNVHRVIVTAPRPHNVITPVKNATIAAGQPVLVRWTVPSPPAEGARLDTKNFGPVTFPDSGSYEVPGGVGNPARPDQRIRVSRINEVAIAGGLPGSVLRVTVRRTVEPVVVQ